MSVSMLRIDPEGWRINGCSFQQDAIVTVGDLQYTCFYSLVDEKVITGDRYVTLGRRELTGNQWNYITFTDYIQGKDDGHNIISIGISGDGVIHISWDMHGDGINYRKSDTGAAFDKSTWSTSQFSKVLKYLEGDDNQRFNWDEITYPRFLTLPQGDMLFEFRIGRSGLGDEYLYRYFTETGRWKPVATPYIQGIANNAYLHGFDYSKVDKRIHVSWTYRDFVDDRIVNKSGGTSQAGPNGPENNHDLYYIYSPDEGVTWYNNQDLKLDTPVNTHSEGTLVVNVPKYSGIMNQEGQLCDLEGGFHVLGRSNGVYYHYYRNPATKKWLTRKIMEYEAPVFGARGKLAVSPNNTVIALLPLKDFKFTILKAVSTPAEYSADPNEWEVVKNFDNLDGEPLVDRYRNDGVLSIFQRQAEIQYGTPDPHPQGRYCLVIDVNMKNI